jgi:Na+/proline symporter
MRPYLTGCNGLLLIVFSPCLFEDIWMFERTKAAVEQSMELRLLVFIIAAALLFLVLFWVLASEELRQRTMLWLFFFAAPPLLMAAIFGGTTGWLTYRKDIGFWTAGVVFVVVFIAIANLPEEATVDAMCNAQASNIPVRRICIAHGIVPM